MQAGLLDEMGKLMVGKEAKELYKNKRKLMLIKPKRKAFEPVAEENQILMK